MLDKANAMRIDKAINKIEATKFQPLVDFPTIKRSTAHIDAPTENQNVDVLHIIFHINTTS